MAEDRNYSSNNNQGRNNRPYRSGRHNQNRSQGRGGRGRSSQKRPLLTTATNAAGLGLVAIFSLAGADAMMAQILGIAVGCFCLSALISYVAQRVKAGLVEKVSDLFFLIGIVLFAYVAITWTGLVAF